MINLLPEQYRLNIRYGRTNASLRLWVIGLLVAIAGLVAVIAAGSLYLGQQSKSYQRTIDSTKQQLQAQNLTKVQKDADEISGDIKLINRLLSQEVRFSDLIQAIGQVMPPGTVLGSLSLSKVNGAIDLNANAKDSASAAQIAANLNDPANNLFSKVDIVNVTCTGNSDVTYKCSTTLRALFSKDAQTKFLNVPKGTKP